MDDGRIIDGKAFLSPPKKGRVAAIFGDTKVCPQAVRAAQNADVLVHEATFVAGDEETAERVFHSTVADAAKLALQANVKQLYLTHISARYTEEKTTPDAGAAGTNYISRVESGWRFRRIRYLNPYYFKKADTMSDHKTHFGFTTVDEDEKAGKVAEVFHSVAKNYDIMNDVMSGGLHRVWKHFTINTARLKKGDKVLDIAGGTGDLSRGWAKRVGKEGEVWLTDINSSMLTVGRDRLLNEGMILPVSLADAEKLPFPDNYFNLVSVAFGLRNMTHKDAALKEMYRVLKPGGTLLVLEFSKVYKPLEGVYDLYSFKLLPIMGKLIAKDADSYQYLAESIRMHPDQETLKQMMLDAGFDSVDYHNMSAGIVALHKGVKF